MIGFRQKKKGCEDMTFILIEDEQKCNFCVYWTGMRKPAEEFVYVDVDSAEWGMCLHPRERRNGTPRISCGGCSKCKNTKSMLSDPFDT